MKPSLAFLRGPAVLLCAALAVNGCSGPTLPTTVDLVGVVDFGEPVLVPGERLRSTPACGGRKLSFDHWMNLYFTPGLAAAAASEDATETVELTLRGAVKGSDLQARLENGGWTAMEKTGDRARTARFDIALDGAHTVRFQVRRVGAAYNKPLCTTDLDVLFRGEHVGGVDRREFRIAKFLREGAWGRRRVKRAGFITVGAREALPIGLPGCRDCEWQTSALNWSKEEVTVALRSGSQVDEKVIAPGEEVALKVPVRGRAVELVTQTDGPIFWAEPRRIDAAGTEEHPSVLLLTLDTTRRDHVEPYSLEPFAEELYGEEPKPRTPRLAELAAESTVFHNAVATAPWTLPSHLSMLTGLYPAEHRVAVNIDFVPREQVVLFDELRRRGYYMVGIACGPMVGSRFGFGRFFDRLVDPPPGGCDGAEANRHALQALEDAGTAPLALMINYFDPHYPYNPPADAAVPFGVAERIARVQDKRVKLMAADLRRAGPGWSQLASRPVSLPQSDLDWLRAAYRAEVLSMDRFVGQVMDAFREDDRWDDAFVAAIADHGEYLGERDLFSHAHRLEPELMRIPFFIRWPGLETGDRYDTVSQIDLAATLAGALDLPLLDSSALDLQRQAPSGRLVLMEEHESRVHPLFPGLRLGPHIIGGVRGDQFFMEWDGGSLCGTFEERGWSPSLCTDDFGGGRLLSRVAAKLEADSQGSAGGLDAGTEDLLRAIGYIE
ncbi:MAG: sulfatase [Acidobacteriota bacterium]